MEIPPLPNTTAAPEVKAALTAVHVETVVRLYLIEPDTVFFPPQEENNRSLLVRIDRGQSSLLLTGDLEREGELALLEDPDKAPLLAGVDVLQVAHHGANTSSTPDFLLRSMPAIALISVGENSYGHPEEEVLQRLESLDAHIFSTKENATVELSTAGDGLFIVHTARGGTT